MRLTRSTAHEVSTWTARTSGAGKVESGWLDWESDLRELRSDRWESRLVLRGGVGGARREVS